MCRTLRSRVTQTVFVRIAGENVLLAAPAPHEPLLGLDGRSKSSQTGAAHAVRALLEHVRCKDGGSGPRQLQVSASCASLQIKYVCPFVFVTSERTTFRSGVTSSRCLVQLADNLLLHLEKKEGNVFFCVCCLI